MVTTQKSLIMVHSGNTEVSNYGTWWKHRSLSLRHTVTTQKSLITVHADKTEVPHYGTRWQHRSLSLRHMVTTQKSLITVHGDITHVTTRSYPKAQYFQLISDVLDYPVQHTVSLYTANPLPQPAPFCHLVFWLPDMTHPSNRPGVATNNTTLIYYRFSFIYTCSVDYILLCIAASWCIKLFIEKRNYRYVGHTQLETVWMWRQDKVYYPEKMSQEINGVPWLFIVRLPYVSHFLPHSLTVTYRHTWERLAFCVAPFNILCATQ